MIKLKIILKKVRLALIKDNQESLNFLKKLNKNIQKLLKKEKLDINVENFLNTLQKQLRLENMQNLYLVRM